MRRGEGALWLVKGEGFIRLSLRSNLHIGPLCLSLVELRNEWERGTFF